MSSSDRGTGAVINHSVKTRKNELIAAVDCRGCERLGEILCVDGGSCQLLHRHHVVPLLLVAGQHGFLHVDGEQYFIEPVKGHWTVSGAGHPHLIYRRSALQQQQQQQARTRNDKVSMCGLETAGDITECFAFKHEIFLSTLHTAENQIFTVI